MKPKSSMRAWISLLSAISALTWMSFSASAQSGSPLWEGLSESLPIHFIEDGGFVSFEEIETRIRSPLATHIVFDGDEVSPKDHEALAEIFESHFFAKLPKGMPIQVNHQRSGRDSWTYPEGTQVIHQISLKADPAQIFELRLEQKMADQRWGFGVYLLENQKLKLRQSGGGDPERLVWGGDVTHELSFHRIGTQTCRSCHFATTPEPERNREAAGPCGFVPGNRSLIADWAERYQQKHGEAPFR